MKYKNIIIKDLDSCFICGKRPAEIHHTMFGKNRKKATEDGLVVALCYEHHRGRFGVHGSDGHDIDLQLKKISEQKWLEYYGKDINDFISRYGKNYL